MEKEINNLEEIVYLLKRMIEIHLETISKQKEYEMKREKESKEFRQNIIDDITVRSTARAWNDLNILRTHFTSVERKIINKLQHKENVKKLIDIHGTKAIYNEMKERDRIAKARYEY